MKPEFKISPPPGAVDWFDGLLLTEAHFRTVDKRVEQLLAYTVQSAMPYFWGIHVLKLDTTGLAEGILRVTKLEGILPHGRPVVYPREEFRTAMGLPDSLMIDLKKRVAEDPARWREGTVGFVSLVMSESKSNERSEDEPGPGWSAPVEDDSIQRVQIVLSLRLDHSPPEDALPLAIVFPRGGGSFSLDNRYVAPTPFVEPSSFLHEKCSGLVDRVRKMAREAVAQAGLESVAGEARLKAYALIAGLPQVEAALDTGVSHPFQLHLAFCHLAGHLAGATLESALPKLPAYDHRDIWTSFKNTFSIIENALLQWPDGYEQQFFTWDDRRRCFSLRLSSGWVRSRLLVSFAPKLNVERQFLIGWVQNAVIAFRPAMDATQRRRELGIDRTLLTADRHLGFVPDDRAVVIELVLGANVLAQLESAQASDEDALVLEICNPDDTSGSPSALSLYILSEPKAAPPPDAADAGSKPLKETEGAGKQPSQPGPESTQIDHLVTAIRLLIDQLGKSK